MSWNAITKVKLKVKTISEILMEKLPTELFLNICENLSLRDIIHLQNASSRLNKQICAVSKTIVISKLYKAVPHNNLDNVHILLSNYIQDYLNGQNTNINLLSKELIYFYYLYNSIKDYPNQLEVYLTYLLLQIHVFKNCKQADNLIETFYEFEKHKTNNLPRYKFTNMLPNYIRFIIENNIDVKLTTLYKMSKICTSVTMLDKLFAYKYLELENSDLVVCCEECVRSNLRHIVEFKYNRPTDHFLNHNYLVIKNFIRNKHKHIYRKLIRYELYHINKEITVTHPQYLTQMTVSSFHFKKFFYKLQFEEQNRKNVTKLISYISKKQKSLLNYHFSSYYT
jgi:hypothetical protein